MKLQKGAIGLWIIFLAVVVVLGLMLTGGLATITQKTQSTDKPQSYLIQEDNLNANGDKSLQLKKIGFIEVIPKVVDCGHGAVKGFNEGDILWAIDPGPGQFVGQGGSIKAFYADEHPITLGAGSVSPNSANPDHVVGPSVGDTSKKDSNGFPYFPAIFITDITDNSNDQSGDVQNGGKASPPDELYGTWKPLGTSSRENKNGLNLGSGADPFPKESNLIEASGTSKNGPREPYTSAEIIWKVDNLKVNDQPLINGHTYRVQLILHDGDRDGDIGQTCTTIKY
jgi:hypothetical protein